MSFTSWRSSNLPVSLKCGLVINTEITLNSSGKKVHLNHQYYHRITMQLSGLFPLILILLPDCMVKFGPGVAICLILTNTEISVSSE